MRLVNRWPRKPKNLLGRSLIVEVVITVDQNYTTKVDVSNLDATVLPEPLVKALLAATGALGLKAEELAKQAGVDVSGVLG